MRTIDEIRNTPVLLLADDEIAQLDPEGQAYARLCKANRARETTCPGHEPTGTSTRNGWHSLKCRHCGKDMSYDSGN
jgi:hypothetical protein